MANRCLHQSHWLRIWHSISCPPPLPLTYTVCALFKLDGGGHTAHIHWYLKIFQRDERFLRERKKYLTSIVLKRKFDLVCPSTRSFSKYCDWDSVWLGAAADGFRFRHFWQETPSDVEYHCSGWRPLLHYAIPLSVDSSVPQIDASPDPPSLPFLIRSSGESRSQAGFPLEPPHSPRSQIYWPLLAGFCLPPSFIQVVFFTGTPPKSSQNKQVNLG